MERRESREGFTLIEMAVVLVIIGLIVGGILVGRDLIRTAGMRSQLAQIERLKTTVMTFKGKYNCIPADCPNATTFFGATDPKGNTITNGNGDGKINAGITSAGTNNGWGNWSGTYESNFFWEHMALSGLWAGPFYDGTANSSNTPGIGYPVAAYQSTGAFSSTLGAIGNVNATAGIRVGYEPGYLTINDGNKIRWTGTSNLPADGSVFFTSGLNPADAYWFDTKIDDGLPLSGKLYISSNNYIYRVPGDTNNSLWQACLVANNNQYNINDTSPRASRACFVDMDADF